jgi:DNA-binding SARP family transcriptional activator
MAYLRLMGGACIEEDGGPLSGPVAQRHRLALLALLSTAGPAGISREKALAHLWPEKDTRRGANLLRQAVHYVRKAAGSDAIASSGGVLILDPRVLPSDVHAFREAAASGGLQEAADLYAGPFLDGFHLPGSWEFDRWASEERRRLEDRHHQCLEALAREAGSAGNRAEAVRWWTRRTLAEPLNGRAALRLVKAKHAAGDPAGALAHARRFADLLRKEVGVPPPPDIQAYVDELTMASPAREREAPAPGR